MTMSFTKEEILGFVDKPMIVPDYPCHTQAVERAIRLVTEASSSVIGQAARDGVIRQKIKTRKNLKTHATKKDFFPLIKDKCDWRKSIKSWDEHLAPSYVLSFLLFPWIVCDNEKAGELFSSRFSLLKCVSLNHCLSCRKDRWTFQFPLFYTHP